ncbi:MAG: carboxypeptidase regulatory-like domain-containing protein [Halalkalicoccus sp.]
MVFNGKRTRTACVLAMVLCVLLAGCGGFGTDGPGEGEDEDETDGLEEVDDEEGPDDESDAPEDDEEVEEDADEPDAPDEDADAPGDDREDTDESDAPDEDADAPEEDDETDAPDEEEEAPDEDTDAPEDDEEEEVPDEGTDAPDDEEEEIEDDTDESDAPEDDEEAEEDTPDEDEYASPADIAVESVTHMEEAGTNHDSITLTNTNDELPLLIDGWEIEMEGQDDRIPIEEEIVIEPGESHTIEFEEGEKTLEADGGVIHLYDSDGEQIGSWDHIGSPSAPPERTEDTGYVQVTVTDAETDEWIEDAEVAIGSGDEQWTGSTDGGGVTTVLDVPYGEHELTVTHDEYAEHTETVVVGEEGTEMTVELEPAGDALRVPVPAATIA